MMRIEQLIFLAFLAIATSSEAQKCSGFDKCRRCVKKDGCQWLVAGKEKSCVENSVCDKNSGICYDDGELTPKEVCKLAAPFPKTCEDIKGCKKCLDNDECSFYTNPQTGAAKCISSINCWQQDMVYGVCHTGESFEDNKKACRRIKKGKPPRPCGELDGDKGGSCYTCMQNGCYWFNEEQTCLNNCNGVDDDDTCQGTTPPRPLPRPIIEDIEPDEKEEEELGVRKTLSFPDQASALCYTLNDDYKDIVNCREASGDCYKCTETLLVRRWPFLWDDPLYIDKSCQYLPETGECVPNGGRATCKPPPGCGHAWPRLLNKNAVVAEQWLVETYNDYYNIVVCPTSFPIIPFEEASEVEGDPNVRRRMEDMSEQIVDEKVTANMSCYTKDLRCDRIRLWVEVAASSDVRPIPTIVSITPEVG